jgi:predicted unusual protein kinase regulating ubiquinone biosynthesis (AarF/ABC1/UbiB family)
MSGRKVTVSRGSADEEEPLARISGSEKFRRGARRVKELAGLSRKMVHLSRASNGSAAKAARASVVDRLAALHGLPQKIGQVLSLGELYGEEQPYAKLTECPATLPGSDFFHLVELALARPLDQCFSRMEESGAAASLAQVHRAWLLDERAVAVKMQYPGIAQAIETDLRALGWLTIPVGGLRRGFDLAGYRREVGNMLRQEVDTIHEAEMIRRFSDLTGEIEGIEVPRVIEDLSGKNILTMTWLEGEPFSSTQKWNPRFRRMLGESLVELFLRGIFQWGLLHADPHPGNYRFSIRNGKPVIGLLDFGCVKPISAETSEALASIIADTQTGRIQQNENLALARFQDLGFKEQLLEPMAHLLPDLAAALFEPFCSEKLFSVRAWRLSEKVQDILGDFRWNFRMAGPPELIYFVRAFQGLVQYLDALETPIDWHSAYESVRPTTGGACAANAGEEKIFPMEGLSRYLRICVWEAGCEKAKVTFRATAAENLCDLVPPEIEGKLVERGIDVQNIAATAKNANFPPGELFRLDEGVRKIRVWLE